jgi:hypothetical protein
MQDGPRSHQINDWPQQFALELIDVDRGIEQKKCLSGGLDMDQKEEDPPSADASEFATSDPDHGER